MNIVTFEKLVRIVGKQKCRKKNEENEENKIYVFYGRHKNRHDKLP